MKQCNKCGEIKPLSDFYKLATMRDGHRNDCKVCNLAAKKARYDADPRAAIARVQRWQQANKERHLAAQRKRRQHPDFKRKERDAHLRRKFGITLDEYDEMLRAQGGVCAICGRPPRDDISLHVDHDHEHGRIRGLLCFRCNNALGDFGDDYDTLLAAQAYLDAHDPEQQELADIARERLRGLVTPGR